ncbi:hypothetical protein RIF29_12656 [Crotalaria pallida]|uniref:Uncharacterized protein n=1 Tax=Crotalaria pallida TaxID=3830 RepID=A0AAN9INN0_CROPI
MNYDALPKFLSIHSLRSHVGFYWELRLEIGFSVHSKLMVDDFSAIIGADHKGRVAKVIVKVLQFNPNEAEGGRNKLWLLKFEEFMDCCAS